LGGRKTRNTDSVRTEFVKLNARLPFKHLRKTSATALGSQPEFRAYAQYFLGHAPETVADTHYVRPSQEQFDFAIAWSCPSSVARSES
jgi:hypothetical protein